MKTNFNFSQRGFSLVEIILAIVLFAGVSVAIWRLAGISQRFNTEATSMAQQNVYSTLRAQIALQGLNPTSVTNLAAPALTDSGGTAVTSYHPGVDQRTMRFVRGLVASFETSSLKSATGANRAQPGSAQRTAINYQTPSLSLQTSKGIGFGYSIGSTGSVVVAPSPTPLAAPTFNYNSGDLTTALNSAPLGLNGIINYPQNPPGTTYRYTTNGSTPTIASPIWNNNPGWTVNSFPHTVTIAAFNSDPQWSSSASASATYTYTYTLSANFSRADGRGDLYNFTYADLQNPPITGIVLRPSIPGAIILYTTDSSTPSQTNGTIYSGAFAPAASLFNPTVPLSILVVYAPTSPDPRYIYASAPVTTYTLNPAPVPLADPAILTDNSHPLQPGTVVNISLDNSPSLAAPDTKIGIIDLGDTLNVTLY